ncbi:MAG TPA: outer membrane protein assembly factor BamD [Steroidobacteraceae bacterium]|jgi:outer membrane protein assembly factor BamD|nr:outer membrane protein assembly factor BamD [Steroidobacteraceae bacterium]
MLNLVSRYVHPTPSGLRVTGHLRSTIILGVSVCALALGGCAHHKHEQSSPEVLYQRAHHDMDEYNFNGAIKTYEQLTALFPFTDQAHQAQLDLIYAYYRAGETDSAIDACDTFIRENPTHPRVDYAYYMEGLTNFEKQPNPIEKTFHVDLSKRPPTTANKSFAAFRTVVTEYPKSAYAYDARQRMVYLRDRLASYDVAIARYYLTRGAYIGAVRRSKLVIDNYEGSPATKDALAIMIVSYDRLGLKTLADQSRKVYAANFTGAVAQVAAAATPRHWWHFW